MNKHEQVFYSGLLITFFSAWLGVHYSAVLFAPTTILGLALSIFGAHKTDKVTKRVEL